MILRNNPIVFMLICVFALSAGVSAQNITGSVHSNGSSLSLESAHIYLEGSQYECFSSINGTYKLNKVKKGTYVLHCELLGYAHYSQNLIVSDEDQIINIRLKESTIDLDEILVSSGSITGGLSGFLTLPGSAHYISSKELQKLNTTDPHEILRNLPGVQIQDEDGFGLRPNIGLRGTGTERSSKITIMEDGILASPAPYAAPAAYYFPTLGRMNAIEVRKGSGQIQYGPFTTGGMINGVSTPIPDRFSGRIKINAGNYDFRNIHAYMGNSHKNLSYLIEGFQYSSSGFKELDNRTTGFDKKDYIAKVRYQSNQTAKIYQSITAKIGEAHERSNETYLGLAAEDFDKNAYLRYSGSQLDEMNTKQRQMVLTHLIQPHKNIFITTSIYKNTFKRNWYKLDKVKGDDGEKVSINSLLNNPEDYANAFAIVKGETSLLPDALHVKANNRSYTSEGVQSKINAIISDQHSIEFGMRLHRDQMDRFQWIDEYQMLQNTMELTKPGVHGTESNRIEKAQAFASHLLYKFKTNKIEITPGIRLESVNMARVDYGKKDPIRSGTNIKERTNSDKVWIPGIGIQYFATETLNLFGGVHKGYAPQGSTEGTSAESSTNYELGIRVQTEKLFGSITTYFNDYNNLLGSDLSANGGMGTGDLFNGGQVQSWGIESQASYNYILNEDNNLYIPIELNYTYSQAKFKENFESNFEAWDIVEVDDELPYMSSHQLNFHTGINFQKLSINGGANYVSAMRVVAGQDRLTSENSIDGRWLANLNIRYRTSTNVTLTLQLQNALNNKYAVANRPAGLRPGKPRSFTVGISASF